MNAKDHYELDYWRVADPRERLDKYPVYLAAWEFTSCESILEVGCGPLGGFLPLLEARRKVAIDPLMDVYRAAGVCRECEGEFHSCSLEDFETAERFDAVLCANTLDHGELNFSFIPKMAGFLKPGGRLYLHVHLRQKHQLNAGHDHALEEKQLDLHLGDLIQIKRKVLPRDVDGKSYPALVAVWERPR